MTQSTLIKNARIVNENNIFLSDVLIENEIIREISKEIKVPENIEIIDAEGKFLIPGFIDDQVHFREPGMTYKADIYTESKAAVAGGITSFMEMPNTIPNTVKQNILEDKYDIAAETSLANYSFYFGATNDNLDEVLKTNKLALFAGNINILDLPFQANLKDLAAKVPYESKNGCSISINSDKDYLYFTLNGIPDENYYVELGGYLGVPHGDIKKAEESKNLSNEDIESLKALGYIQ